MAKGEPAWAWVRGRLGENVAFFSTALALLILVFQLLDINDPGAALLIGLYVSVAAYAFSSVVHHKVLRRRLPAFELLEPGEQSRGREAVLFMLAFLAQIPAGILVNFVS